MWEYCCAVPLTPSLPPNSPLLLVAQSSLPVTRMFSATCSARRAALTALRALCTGSPASLVKEYDGLASTLLQASRAGQLLASENTVLAESLVLLAHAISDKDKRTASLQALIKDPIDRAVALYQRLQSPDALLAELDVGGGGQGLEGRMHRASLRAALLSVRALPVTLPVWWSPHAVHVTDPLLSLLHRPWRARRP